MIDPSGKSLYTLSDGCSGRLALLKTLFVYLLLTVRATAILFEPMRDDFDGRFLRWSSI